MRRNCLAYSGGARLSWAIVLTREVLYAADGLGGDGGGGDGDGRAGDGPDGVKDFVHNSLDNAVQEHNQAIGEAMDDQNPQGMQTSPAQNAPAAKAGGITRKSKDGKDVRV